MNHADHLAQIAIPGLNNIVQLANLTPPLLIPEKGLEQIVNDVKWSL